MFEIATNDSKPRSSIEFHSTSVSPRTTATDKEKKNGENIK